MICFKEAADECVTLRSFSRFLPISQITKPKRIPEMASSSGKLSIRLLFLVLLLLAAFYIGRPLYWKLSATIHEIREKRQTVKEGFSKFVLDAQKSVGWVHDESDAGFVDEQPSGKATTRRILRFER